MSSASGEAPQFLVVGHMTRDLVGNVVRPGGTASYAAVVASRLGLRTSVLTSAAADFAPAAELAGVTIHRVPAPSSTVMEHRWHGRRRDQYLRSRARTLTAPDVLGALGAASIVLFGPVVDEVASDLLSTFPRALRGATIQGWLRRFDADGRMEPVPANAWQAEPLLDTLQAAFLSEDDLGPSCYAAAAVLERWARRVPILAVTRGDAGARIAIDGRWHRIGAMPAQQVDGTGAGDAFAAGFLIRYHETADAGEAARFATAVGSFVVEAPGLAGAPTRARVAERLHAWPDVRLVAE